MLTQPIDLEIVFSTPDLMPDAQRTERLLDAVRRALSAEHAHLRPMICGWLTSLNVHFLKPSIQIELIDRRSTIRYIGDLPPSLCDFLLLPSSPAPVITQVRFIPSMYDPDAQALACWHCQTTSHLHAWRLIRHHYTHRWKLHPFPAARRFVSRRPSAPLQIPLPSRLTTFDVEFLEDDDSFNQLECPRCHHTHDVPPELSIDDVRRRHGALDRFADH